MKNSKTVHKLGLFGKANRLFWFAIGIVSSNLVIFQSAHAQQVTSEKFLSWRDIPEASYYAIQIAKDTDFKQIVVDRKLAEQTLALEDLAAGRYYYRLAAIDAKGTQAAFSRPIAIEIESEAIVLQTPVNNLNVDATAASQNTVFEWSELPECDSYELHLARNKNFDGAERFPMTEATFSKALAVDGKPYYWRVRGVYTDNVAGPFSSTYKLTLNYFLPAPELSLPQQDGVIRAVAGRASEVKLSWGMVKGAASYEVSLLNKSADIETPLATRKTTNIEEKIKLPPGSYRWRVRAISKTGNPGPYSKERTFDVTGMLPTPVLVNPGKKEVIRQTHSPIKVNFRWSAASESTSAELQIAADEKFTKVLHKMETKKRSVTQALAAGAYFARVRVFANGLDGSAWSRAVSFKLIEQKNWEPTSDVQVNYIYSFENMTGATSEFEGNPGMSSKLGFSVESHNVLFDYLRVGGAFELRQKTLQGNLVSDNEKQTDLTVNDKKIRLWTGVSLFSFGLDVVFEKLYLSTLDSVESSINDVNPTPHRVFKEYTTNTIGIALGYEQAVQSDLIVFGSINYSTSLGTAVPLAKLSRYSAEVGVKKELTDMLSAQGLAFYERQNRSYTGSIQGSETKGIFGLKLGAALWFGNAAIH